MSLLFTIFDRTNSCFPCEEEYLTAHFALIFADTSSFSPHIERMTGFTNRLNMTIHDVGKPGRTTTGFFLCAPSTTGFPGFTATPCTSIPGVSILSMTLWQISPVPAEVPPEIMIASYFSAFSSKVSISFSSSFAIPKNSALAPHSLHAPTIIAEFTSYIFAPVSLLPGGISSLPVEITATLGLENTLISVTPMAASTPRSQELIRMPRR